MSSDEYSKLNKPYIRLKPRLESAIFNNKKIIGKHQIFKIIDKMKVVLTWYSTSSAIQFPIPEIKLCRGWKIKIFYNLYYMIKENNDILKTYNLWDVIKVST